MAASTKIRLLFVQAFWLSNSGDLVDVATEEEEVVVVEKVEREEGEEVGKVPLAPVSLDTTLCHLCPHAPIIVLRDPRSTYVGIYSDVLGAPHGGAKNAILASALLFSGRSLFRFHA